MNSKAAASFWKCRDRLPAQVQKLAEKNFRLWLANPDYPSLHFKPFEKNFCSVRIGDHYRAVGYYRNSQTLV
ncbi:MAG TPA: hypothetical protein VFY06_07850 [Verrucomicrobiae bacterium]|nr:hypothetical protein [Verrucomicrobiae bacterium]